jgi:hypothetical protein
LIRFVFKKFCDAKNRKNYRQNNIMTLRQKERISDTNRAILYMVGNAAPLHPAQSARVPNQEIFEEKLPVTAIQRCAASAAFYLTVKGLRPDVGFDDLIERTAIRALERFCSDHDRSTTPLRELDTLCIS